ncbi:thioredoxin domain-containing protein, partial [Streptomyces scabiei]|uniref:thioredoxin domain-containing protein n=1 Tax=Streptomyces scabiei TaxID=1930 RepID=UPI0038F65E4D
LYAVAPKPIKAEKPSVVKSYAVVQYASWCPLCKELDPKIEAAKNDAVKAGVEIETFDFTDEAASKASLAKAKSLGLEKFVTEGATGFA